MLYISRKERRGRRVIFLAVNAGAGGVAVARDGERRGGWAENGEGLTLKVES